MVRHEDIIITNENCKEDCSAANETSEKVSRDVIQSNQDSFSLDEEQVKVDTEMPKAPDGGWGWFVVLGCFLVHFILGKLHLHLEFLYTRIHLLCVRYFLKNP